jgi:hypothetical protein
MDYEVIERDSVSLWDLTPFVLIRNWGVEAAIGFLPSP